LRQADFRFVERTILKYRHAKLASPIKTYGRLSAPEFKRLLVAFQHARANQRDLEKEARARGGKLASLLAEHGAYWWVFYDIELPQHLALFIILLGWSDALAACAKEENPTRAFLEFASREDAESRNPFEQLEPEMQAVYINLLVGISYSIESLGYFGASINELLGQARDGKQSSLLKAVEIDRSVLCTETGAAIIAMAQLERNKALFSGLFKRMKSPHAGRRQYMDLRYIHAALRDANALTQCSSEELLELVGDKLRLYSTKSGDPVKGLRELFRAWSETATR
jgi:hypothetical protein